MPVPITKARSLKRTGEMPTPAAAALLLPQREARQPGPAAGERAADQHREREKDQAEGEELGPAEPQLEQAHARDPADAERAAEEGHVQEDGLDDEVDADRRDGQEVLAHPQAREPQQQPDERAHGDHDRQRRPEGEAGLDRQQRRRVGADPEEGRVAERDLPGEAHDHVEAAGHDGVDGDDGAERDEVSAHPCLLIVSPAAPGAATSARRSWR